MGTDETGFGGIGPRNDNNLAVDLKSVATGKGASMVGIRDVGNLFASATVEAALQEQAARQLLDEASIPTVAANAAFSVNDKTALLAIDSTSLGDGVFRRVKTYRRNFQYAKTGSYTPVDGEIFASPTGGYWVWDNSYDPFWIVQAAYTVDPVSGDDEGVTTVKTVTELARRLGYGRLTAPMSITVNSNLNAGDTRFPQCQSDLTNFISWTGVPRLLFTGTVVAITNRNGSTNQPTLMTISTAATSWTAGDGVTSGLNMIVVQDNGAGNFVAARVCRDMGSQQAWLSAPINQGNLESTFTNGSTVSVYDVPSLGNIVYHNTAKQSFKYLKVAQRWLSASGQLSTDRCWGDCFLTGGTVSIINGVSGGLFSGANLQNLGSRLTITGGFHRLINVGGTCNIAQTATFTALQIENSQVFSLLGGVFGVADVEICCTSTGLTPVLMTSFGFAWFNCHGYLYGSTARLGSLLTELSGRNGTVSLGHVPNVTGANLISYNLVGTNDNVSVLSTRESNDINGNRVIGPAGPIAAPTVVANGTVPVALGSVGPAGVSGTPSRWVKIPDGNGGFLTVASYT